MATRRRSNTDTDDGFTLVEFVVALGIMAFLMAALAASLVGLMNAIGAQKSRSQANDLASIGMEDLQRLSYNDLGLCAAPSGTAPAGFADTVLLAACGSATKYGPCEASAPPANAAPDEEYTCRRRGVDYTVKRYIAYGDVAHTEKRLGIYVEWTDTAGNHLIDQQSSLRIPSQSAVVGAAPPRFSSTSVTPTGVSLNADGSGRNVGDILLSAQAVGLQAGVGDSVIAVFSTISDGVRQHRSVPMTSTNGESWTGVVPDGGTLADGTTLAFGHGSQFVTFTATRKADGKVNSSTHETPLTLTAPTPPPYVPTMVIMEQPPSAVALTPSGNLQSSFTFKVRTDWVSPDDSVTATFETRTGAVSLALTPAPYENGQCSESVCRTDWTATVTPEAGYSFATGTRRIYFEARQTPTSATYPNIDKGATVAVASSTITFS